MAISPARELVIVLDDDPSVLRSIQRLLKAYGIDCELFQSVHDFQSRARLHLASCLVLDINLDGESGINLRKKLAVTWPSIPAIFITANDSEGSRKAATEAGCIAYHVKPFSAKSLIGAIEKASAKSAH